MLCSACFSFPIHFFVRLTIFFAEHYLPSDCFTPMRSLMLVGNGRSWQCGEWKLPLKHWRFKLHESTIRTLYEVLLFISPLKP
jgi:hypothetical protein